MAGRRLRQTHAARRDIWDWSADVSRSGARDDSDTGGSKSFRVVRTLNVQ
jgi:hypothetical protein